MPNYRRIIDAYRSKLMEVSPAACNEVDDQMYAEGEKWVCDERPIDPDKLMTAPEIADRIGYKVYDIRNWARRNPDAIPAHRDGRNVRYRLGDVLRFWASNQ